MHLGSRRRCAPRLDCPHRLLQRHRWLRCANLGETKRELARRAARRVDLVVVRVVDDLPLRDQAGRGFGELLQQHHRQREVAAGEHAALLRTRRRVDLRIVGLGQAGGADHDVGAALERGQDVGLGARRLGVFDEDVARFGERFGGRRVVDWLAGEQLPRIC